MVSDGRFLGTNVNLVATFQSLNLWLHLIFMAVWIGGMVFFLFVFAPAVHSLAPADGIRALSHGRRSFEILSWIALNLLFLTGVLNFLFRAMASGLHLGVVYYSILALKLLLFLAMTVHHSLQAFKYAPKIAALTSQSGDGVVSWPEPLLANWSKWFRLLKINTTLGAVVLLLGLALSWR